MTTPTPSCLITGLYIWTVTNTGNSPLTGSPINPTGIVSGGGDSGTLGGVSFGGNSISISDNLAPGETGTVSVNTISKNNGSSSGGAGIFQVTATFNETACAIQVDLTCTLQTPSDRRLKRDI